MWAGFHTRLCSCLQSKKRKKTTLCENWSFHSGNFRARVKNRPEAGMRRFNLIGPDDNQSETSNETEEVQFGTSCKWQW